MHSASWPGQMRTVWGDHARFFQTYFATYPGDFAGDGVGATRTAITGSRAGRRRHRRQRPPIGTAEVESALVLHPLVGEAAVVGFPHDVEGQGVFAYVTLNAGEVSSTELATGLRNWVRKEISPIATPDAIQFAPGLPKTRSGRSCAASFARSRRVT